MRMIKKYLKLRKQNDLVKLITLLFIVLIAFIVSSVVNTYQFYREIHTNTEYLLTSSDNIEKLKIKLDKIREMDKSIAAGIENDYYISFNNGEKSILVKEMSRDYLSECYKIEDDLFHLNYSAYKLLNNKSTEFMTLYQKDDKKRNGSFIFQENLTDSTPFALVSGTSASLGNNTGIYTVSAMFESADISGETLKKIEALSFEIKNKSDIERQKYSQELFFVKLRYNLLIILMTVFCISVLLKRNIELTALQKNNFDL